MSDPAQRRELVYSFPLEFAVFDSEFGLRAVDLPIPKSMVPFEALVDKKGQIVALKDQEQAGVEEDFHTVYKFKMVYGGE
ncbi:hypothetical protein [Cyclobacterium jeungdonense]|uniref:hypothetical protein n=1 Tax=Cyclobacterium jeungdonense TaxID=708087 RepID=UPI0025B5499A|nr:hypothetical protein [Cyclobacterium jeungdonense]